MLWLVSAFSRCTHIYLSGQMPTYRMSQCICMRLIDTLQSEYMCSIKIFKQNLIFHFQFIERTSFLLFLFDYCKKIIRLKESVSKPILMLAESSPIKLDFYIKLSGEAEEGEPTLTS